MPAARANTVFETRDRIVGCADLDTLGRWLDLAFTASGADELFTEGDSEGR